MTPLGQAPHSETPAQAGLGTDRRKPRAFLGDTQPQGQACGMGLGRGPPTPRLHRTRQQLADVSAGTFPLSMSPIPSPSPKWLQLSGPQIGTAGTGLARCPPPSRVCLRERKPAHLWNPSLSPRSASPTCPPGARGQPPCSVSLFPWPLSDYNAGSVQCSLSSPCTKRPPRSSEPSCASAAASPS